MKRILSALVVAVAVVAASQGAAQTHCKVEYERITILVSDAGGVVTAKKVVSEWLTVGKLPLPQSDCDAIPGRSFRDYCSNCIQILRDEIGDGIEYRFLERGRFSTLNRTCRANRAAENAAERGLDLWYGTPDS